MSMSHRLNTRRVAALLGGEMYHRHPTSPEVVDAINRKEAEEEAAIRRKKAAIRLANDGGEWEEVTHENADEDFEDDYEIVPPAEVIKQEIEQKMKAKRLAELNKRIWETMYPDRATTDVNKLSKLQNLKEETSPELHGILDSRIELLMKEIEEAEKRVMRDNLSRAAMKVDRLEAEATAAILRASKATGTSHYNAARASEIIALQAHLNAAHDFRTLSRRAACYDEPI